MDSSQPDFRLLTAEARSGDLLQHAPLARALAKAIRDTPRDESIGIALYGAWGQGKSMIGGLVETELSDVEFAGGQKVVFVRIDAWKYAHEGDRQPLRRHYLLRAYESAGLKEEAERLRRAFAQTIVSESLDPENFAVGLLRLLATRLRENWRLVAFAIPIGVALWLLHHLLAAVVLSVLGIAGLVVATTSLLLESLIRVLVAGLTVTTEEDPFRSVEEFDDQLTKLFSEDATNVDRFVFFIDDLDRCKDATVVEAIETLQAFFERDRCAYIVAADENQLKRAVRSKSSGPAGLRAGSSIVPIDETFLEKIFQTNVYVPPLYPETLLMYAQEVATETRLMRLPPAEREDILGYLVHPDVVSPRQVRVILNDFLLTLSESEERESEPSTFLTDARLTRHPLFIARMVVLRAHFPWFYALLYDEPELLLQWPATFNKEPEEWREHETGAEESVSRAAGLSVERSRSFVEETGDKTAGPSPDEDARYTAAGPSLNEDGEVLHLVDALRRYLTLTQDSAPTDAAEVEEFLYLRGREGFAGLTGERGRALRLAISTGDLRGLRNLLEASNDQALAATQAAIDQAGHGTRLGRTAARSALVEIVKHVPSAELSLIGPAAVQTLYPRGGAARLAADDVDARQALVPWLRWDELRQHVENEWPDKSDDLAVVLDRGTALERQRELLELAAGDLDDSEFAENVLTAITSGDARPGEYADAACFLARRLSRPSEERKGVGFTVQSVTGRSVTGTDVEKGVVSYALARGLNWPAAENIGRQFNIDLQLDHGAWRVVSVADPSGPSPLWSVQRQAILGSELRESLMRLIQKTLGAARSVSTPMVERLGDVHCNFASEEVKLVEVVRVAASESRLEDPQGALSFMLTAANWSNRQEIAAAVVNAATSFPDEAVRANGRQIVRYVLAHTEYWEPDEALPEASEAYASVAPEIASGGGAAAAAEALDPDFELSHKVRAIAAFIEPIDRAAALELITPLMPAVFPDDVTDGEDDLQVAALNTLAGIARDVPDEVAELLQTVVVSPDRPSVCLALLRANLGSGSTSPLAANCFGAALETAAEGPALGAVALTQWLRPTPKYVDIFLATVAQQPEELTPRQVADVIRSVHDDIAPIDAIGALGIHGGQALAERVAAELGLKRHPVRELFTAARRGGDELFDRRVRYAEAWKARSRSIDNIAVVGYCAATDKAESEHRLALIMSSLLRYFPDPESVPGRPKLRSSLFDALTRLRPITSKQLQSDFQTARTQLGLETHKTSTKVDRLFARVFES